MYANFIYFLVALILYTTCQVPLAGDTLPSYTLVFFFGLLLFYALVCLIGFRRLETRVRPVGGDHQLDHQLDRLISRLSILAILLFAGDLYVLKIKHLFAGLFLFQRFPTLEALVFLAVFLFYLVILWSSAWQLQKQFFPESVSRRKFVLSNISFSLPALLPWLILSLLADIIQNLPFEAPKAFLATPQGEILYVATFLIAVASLGPLLIQKLWGCTSLESGVIRARIEGLCNKSGLKYADILKWELFGGSMITAGVMGLVAKFRYILVTPALVRLLSFQELDAVIAHEIGHVQRRHIPFYLFFFAGYMVSVYLLFDPLLLVVYYITPLFKPALLLGMDQESVATLAFSLILIGLFLTYFRFGFGFYMRNFERQADLHVFTLLGDVGPLITTFEKIARFSHQSPDKPNWHHYSISRRVSFLRRCTTDGSLIKAHHNKVKKMVWGYGLLFCLVLFAGYSINFGAGKEVFNRFLTETVLIRQLQLNPANTELYALVGDYYYDAEKFSQAIDAYGNVLKIDGDNVHALNNLAWLYATCSSADFRDPVKALDLSRQALALSRVSHILDTHAEACFINGFYDKAFVLAMEARKRATERLEYYESQIQRFKKKD